MHICTSWAGTSSEYRSGNRGRAPTTSSKGNETTHQVEICRGGNHGTPRHQEGPPEGRGPPPNSDGLSWKGFQLRQSELEGPPKGTAPGQGPPPRTPAKPKVHATSRRHGVPSGAPCLNINIYIYIYIYTQKMFKYVNIQRFVS